MAEPPNPSLEEEARRILEAEQRGHQQGTRPLPSPPRGDGGIVITFAAAAFGTGLLEFAEGHLVWAIAITMGSLVMVAPLNAWVARTIWRFSSQRILWALGVATWLFLAINIGLAIHPLYPPPVSPPDQHNAEQQMRLAQARIGELQLGANLAEWNNIPTACTIKLIRRLEQGDRLKTLPRTMIATTSPPNMTLFVDNLHQVLGAASEKIYSEATASQAPVVYPFQFGPTINYQTDLDAPRLNGRGVVGITIHGRNPMGDFLREVFSDVFVTHQTGEDLPAEQLLAYYHRVGANFLPYDNVVWIEVGSGPLLSPHTHPGYPCY